MMILDNHITFMSDFVSTWAIAGRWSFAKSLGWVTDDAAAQTQGAEQNPFGLEIHNPSDVLPRNPFSDMINICKNDSPHLFELLTWKTVMTELLFHGEFAGVSYGIPAFPNNIERSEPSRQSKWRMTMMVRMQRLATVSLRFLGLRMTDVRRHGDYTLKALVAGIASLAFAFGCCWNIVLEALWKWRFHRFHISKISLSWSINQHVGWMLLSSLGWACTVPLNNGYRKGSGNVTCNAPSWLIQFQSISPQRPQHGHIFCGAICDHVIRTLQCYWYQPICFHALLSPLKARQSFVNRRPRKQPKPTCVFWLNCRCMLLSLLRQLLRVLSPFGLKWFGCPSYSLQWQGTSTVSNSIYPSEKQGLRDLTV